MWGRKVFRRRVRVQRAGLNLDADVQGVVASNVGGTGTQRVRAKQRSAVTQRSTARPASGRGDDEPQGNDDPGPDRNAEQDRPGSEEERG